MQMANERTVTASGGTNFLVEFIPLASAARGNSFGPLIMWHCRVENSALINRAN